MGVHVGAVSVKNTDDFDFYVVLVVVVHEQRFGHPFAFVVAGAQANGVYMSPVVFGLRMYLRVAVNLAGGGLKDFGAYPFGQPQHVDGAHNRGFYGFYGVVLVMHRRSRTG